MILYVEALYSLTILLYTALIKLSVGLPVRTILVLFFFCIIFVVYNNKLVIFFKRHPITLVLFAMIAIIGIVLTLVNGRGLDTVVGYSLSNIVQPFLIMVCTYVLAQVAGVRVAGGVFLAFSGLTALVAIGQFMQIDAAWQLREFAATVQGTASIPGIEDIVDARSRPVGLSLTPIIFSYQIASAYVVASLFYREGIISPYVYAIIVVFALAAAGANATRSLLLGMIIHELVQAVLRGQIKYLLWVGILIAVSGAGYLYLDSVGSRVATLEDASALGRLVLYTFGLHLAADYPTGLGWGFSPADFAWLYWEHLADYVNADGVFRLGLHNAYLNFFLTYGIIGTLACMLCIYLRPGKFMAFLATFSVYHVNAFFHNNGLFLGEYYIWFAFAIYLYIQDTAQLRRRSKKRVKLAKSVAMPRHSDRGQRQPEPVRD